MIEDWCFIMGIPWDFRKRQNFRSFSSKCELGTRLLCHNKVFHTRNKYLTALLYRLKAWVGIPQDHMHACTCVRVLGY